jgi:hypothetical protein
MFGKILVFVLREFAEPIRKLVKATLQGDMILRKQAIIELDAISEREAMRKARGG